MLNLFLKDVKAGAIFLWAVVPLNMVAALQVSRSGAGFFWANVTCATLILVAVSMLDWKNEAEPFVHSLPVTRAMVVRGRYVTAAAIAAPSTGKAGNPVAAGPMMPLTMMPDASSRAAATLPLPNPQRK
jgi:hypothetical protein